MVPPGPLQESRKQNEMNQMKPVTVTILECDKPNLNGRVYPREAVEKMIADVQTKPGMMGRVFGTIGMPKGSSLDITEISHSVSNLRIMEDGRVMGDMMVLDTPKGKVLKELLSPENHSYSFRTAGIGQIKEENGVKVVHDYRLISISAVSDGA